MDPSRPTRAKLGLFELVLIAVIAVAAYALVARATRHRGAAPARAAAVPTTPPSVAEPTPAAPTPDELAPDEPTPIEPEPAVAVPPEPRVDPPRTQPDEGASSVVESIRSGMTGLRKPLAACGRRHPADGVVKVQVEIAATGRPARVEVLDAPDAALARCVVGVVQKLRLPAGAAVTFTYPLQFPMR